MAISLGESLAAASGEGRATREVHTAVEASRARSAEAQGARRKRAAIEAFVAERLGETVQLIVIGMEKAAVNGDESYSHRWIIPDNGKDKDNIESPDNIEALAQGVGEVLISQDVFTEVCRYRGLTRDWDIPVSDGYSEEHPPMKDDGTTIIGLDTHWGEAARDVRV